MARPRVTEKKIGYSVTISPSHATLLRLISKQNNLSKGIEDLVILAKEKKIIGVSERELQKAIERNPNGAHNVEDDIYT